MSRLEDASVARVCPASHANVSDRGLAFTGTPCMTGVPPRQKAQFRRVLGEQTDGRARGRAPARQIPARLLPAGGGLALGRRRPPEDERDTAVRRRTGGPESRSAFFPRTPFVSRGVPPGGPRVPEAAEGASGRPPCGTRARRTRERRREAGSGGPSASGVGRRDARTAPHGDRLREAGARDIAGRPMPFSRTDGPSQAGCSGDAGGSSFTPTPRRVCRYRGRAAVSPSLRRSQERWTSMVWSSP